MTWGEHLRATGVPVRLVKLAEKPLQGEAYFERVREAAKGLKPGVVYLYGQNGNGKTHMGTWLYSIWHAQQMMEWNEAREKGLAGIGSKLFQPRAMWVTERAMTEALKAYHDERFSFREQARCYTSPEILLIDDVFTERTSETDVSNVTDILETRRDSGRVTIITSNRGPLEMASAYSSRLAERLVDDSLVVEFTGTSERMRRFFQETNN